MRYYFLGICGTAMASLAVLLKQRGHQVWGVDQNVYPPMSDFLGENNISVFEGYNADHLKNAFDVAVIGNALSRGNVEIETILNQRLPFASLPEIIRREFAQSHKNIVITGTHGKTTTTSLVNWLLTTAGYEPTFLIGGISRNLGVSSQNGKGEYFVIEGDEYDTAFFDKRPKFLHYMPYYLIINNIEYDHADIYRDLTHIKDEFKKLLRIVPSDGLIIANGDDPNIQEILPSSYSRIQLFGKSTQNTWSFNNVQISEKETKFTLYYKKQKWAQFSTPLFGAHQITNSMAAIILANEIGLDVNQIQSGLSSFLTVKRRMELWGEINGAPFYDDFAHHPTAIKKTLQAIRPHYPDRRLVAIFEPRTNTTVRNIFQDQLAKALSVANVVILTPIHRGENIPPHERLSLPALRNYLAQQGVYVELLPDYDSLLPLISETIYSNDVAVLMTNGNLGGKYSELKKLIQKQ